VDTVRFGDRRVDAIECAINGGEDNDQNWGSGRGAIVVCYGV